MRIFKAIQWAVIIAERSWKVEGLLENPRKHFTPTQKVPVSTRSNSFPTHSYLLGKLYITSYFLQHRISYIGIRELRKDIWDCVLSPPFPSLCISCFNVLGICEIPSIETTFIYYFPSLCQVIRVIGWTIVHTVRLIEWSCKNINLMNIIN